MDDDSSWFVYPIRVAAKKRDKLIKKLIEKGIQSKAYFYPCIHLQPFYKNEFCFKESDFPVAEKLSQETLILPLYYSLGEGEIKRVVESLKLSLKELDDEN